MNALQSSPQRPMVDPEWTSVLLSSLCAIEVSPKHVTSGPEQESASQMFITSVTKQDLTLVPPTNVAPIFYLRTVQ